MKNNRRNFFKKALVAVGTVTTTSAMAETKMVKMLTPDGKLVEVNADLVQSSPKSKATNKDLLEWSEQIKS